MGPTNVALVKLFRADQQLRAAQDVYDQAARSVRILERKVNELTTKHDAANKALKEKQTKANTLDLDLKSRDEHIEKLRTQQQQTKSAKEYQAYLTEINTEKVDRNKIENEALGMLVEVEKMQGDLKVLTDQLNEEKKKLAETRAALGGRLAELQLEIDKLRPAREEAYNAIPVKNRQAFERLAERHDGEAMSALEKPSRRVEEYCCQACQMSLVTDIYNRLHSRDEMVPCPNCGRLLFIPDELPPELAINKPKEKKETKPRQPKAGPVGAAGMNKQTAAEAVMNSIAVEEETPSEQPPADAPEEPESTEPQPPAQ